MFLLQSLKLSDLACLAGSSPHFLLSIVFLTSYNCALETILPGPDLLFDGQEALLVISLLMVFPIKESVR